MHHAGCGNRDLRHCRADGFQEAEVLTENRVLEFEPSGDLQGRRGEFDVAVRVVELHLQIVLGAGHATDLVQVVHVPGTPAKLPVSDCLKSDVLLAPDDLPDRFILGAAKLRRGQFTALVGLARLKQRLRPQQTADVIGAKRRRCAIHVRDCGSFMTATVHPTAKIGIGA